MEFIDSLKSLFMPRQVAHEAVDLKTGKILTLVKVRQPDGSYIIKRVEGKQKEEPVYTRFTPAPAEPAPSSRKFTLAMDTPAPKPPMTTRKFTLPELAKPAEPVQRRFAIPEAKPPEPRKSLLPDFKPSAPRKFTLVDITGIEPARKFTLPKVKPKEAPQVSRELSKDTFVREAARADGKVDLVDMLGEDIDRALKIKEERDMLSEKLREFEERLGEMDVHKSARKDAENRLTELEDGIVKLREEKTTLEESIVGLKEERDSIRDKIRYYENVLLKIKDKVVQFDQKI